MKQYFTVILVLAALGRSLSSTALAQVGVEPTVSIFATDPQANESGLNGGVFAVRRVGATNFPLAVFFTLSGTASNGVDYEPIGNSVQIAAGALEARFQVTPIKDSLVEGNETVVAQLAGSPLLCAACGYQIGDPARAEIVIFDNDFEGTNHPPVVNFYAPSDGSAFRAPAQIHLQAYARDTEDHYDVRVEFFEGTNSLGLGKFFATLCPDPLCPFYGLTWSNVPPGRYELRARATDSSGAATVSPVVQILVVETNTLSQTTVDIVATDDTGSEIPVVPPWLDVVQRSDPAVFTVTRNGPTNFPMTVFYRVGGTASNGVDYVRLPGSVVIPTGAASATIAVWVNDDLLVEGTETVELTVQPPLCIQIFPPPPDCYLVGTNSRAVASILDNDEKPAPVVTIAATDADASESGPDPGTFTIRRTGDTSNALLVYFRIGGTAQIGLDYLSFSNLATVPRFVDIPNVLIPAGADSVEIRVDPSKDNLAEPDETVVLALEQPEWAGYLVGAPAHATVTIHDADGGNTNHAPVVQLISPHTGEQFPAPADVHLIALVQDAEESYFVEAVEFFDGTNSLGFGAFNPTRCAVCPNYTLTWSNVPPGTYNLRAVATDHQGAAGQSDVVHIRVLGTNVPPDTNATIVTVVATDALAVEGPFCRSNWWWTAAWDGGDWIIAPAVGDPDSLGWRTNGCAGPNTATFAVRRSGPTNVALTVAYELGGTATAGLDYVSLPGTVTIPAGRHAARVEIVPVEDTLGEHIETVLLRLLSAPAIPGATPTYTLGIPAHAAAIIVDNDSPRPPCMKLPDGMFHVCRPATNGHSFTLRASEDLVHWRVLCTNTVTDDAIHYVDPDASDFSPRFYQIQAEPSYRTEP
jgi:hypothetical protein